MTDGDLAAVRARAEAATEGPWFGDSYATIFSEPRTKEWQAAEDAIPDDASDDDPRWAATTALEDASQVAWVTKGGEQAANERFIAHSRADVDFLLARVGELEAENEKLREQFNNLGNFPRHPLGYEELDDDC